jgi:hypothetical protein
MSGRAQADLLRIATVNQQIINATEELYYGLQKMPDSAAIAPIHEYLSTMLVLTQRIAAALKPPYSDFLMIASTNEQIISLTKHLYYSPSSSTPELAQLIERHINRVLDLTGQISVAIPRV